MSVIGKVYSFYIGIRFSDSISPLFFLSLIIAFYIGFAAKFDKKYRLGMGEVYDEDEEVSLQSVEVVAKEPEPTAEDTVRKPVEPKEATEPTVPTVVILIPEVSVSEDSDFAEEDSAEEDTIPYCDTCYDDYSDSRNPRILTKCGHTICEECAKGLLRGNAIRCPYCKKITLVNGPANSLPKNFALMDIVEKEMKKYYVE
ncbi:hypothetical protein GCK72_011238 [Caenorhabditis remanei]|uniref:RING-type domain-containing protein n=1 Tax=Caenorhabditis remanei TaxID=31234 RepID=A0A6A5H963_CAERE|nr:hypothetical protein GCK72_011238 [Caenorhabditis remanei]KAF1762973.1 hypothetical protein GCK72_011238 [Caenorhabditis remanei]